MARIHRVVGDHGPAARISLALLDRDAEPITEGPVTLRAHGLFEGGMTYQGAGVIAGVAYDDGVWFYDPQPDDLDEPGQFPMEVQAGTIVLPASKAHELHVRARALAPAA